MLLGGAAAAGTVVLDACQKSQARPKPASSPSPSASPSPSPSPPDLQAATLAAALENLLMAVYDAAISAATDGRLGVVPAVAVGFLTTTRAHHADHGRAWAALLEQNHAGPVDGTPLTAADTLLRQVAKAKTFTEFGVIAVEAERLAAATYLASVTSAALESVVTTGVSIAPVEAEHAAALALLTGQAPLAHPSAGSLWDLHAAFTVTDLTAPGS